MFVMNECTCNYAVYLSVLSNTEKHYYFFFVGSYVWSAETAKPHCELEKT